MERGIAKPAPEDFLLPLQRQMTSELRHHQMSQQTCGRNVLVDHLGRYRRLDRCFAQTAGPLSTYVLLDRKHAWRVNQFFADVFADALKLAIVSALSVF